MIKAQIPDWHGEDEWVEYESKTSNRTVAEMAAKDHIIEACNYEIIDSDDPITVRINDGENITVWDVFARSSWDCYATLQEATP